MLLAGFGTYINGNNIGHVVVAADLSPWAVALDRLVTAGCMRRWRMHAVLGFGMRMIFLTFGQALCILFLCWTVKSIISLSRPPCKLGRSANEHATPHEQRRDLRSTRPISYISTALQRGLYSTGALSSQGTTPPDSLSPLSALASSSHSALTSAPATCRRGNRR